MAIPQQIGDPLEWSALNVESYWPEHSEDDYYAAANTQQQNSVKAFQSASAEHQATHVVSATMEGQTADAATGRFEHGAGQLENHGVKHDANAVLTAGMGANVQAKKESINAIMANHEAQKAAILSSPMLQHEREEALARLRDETQTQLGSLHHRTEDNHEALKAQLNTGTAELPGGLSVPSDMPGLDQGIADALNAVGNPQTLMGLAGMTQQALNPLTGMLQGQGGGPLDQAIQQGSQTGLQALQQLLGQAGGGQVEITPDQVEELIAGQGGDSTDGKPGGVDPNAPKDADDKPKFENPDHSSDSSADAKADAETETETASAPASAPSPAAEPVSAAPPQSAIPPTTELTSDSGTATMAPPSAGQTHLTGAAGATLAGPALGTPGVGAAAPVGGAGPVGFGPVIGAPLPPTAPQAAPRGGASVADPRLSVERLNDMLKTPATPASTAAPEARVVSGHTQRVRSVLAYLDASYRSAGLPGHIAVAVHADGTMTYATADGLGYVPDGLLLPTGVVPLCEYASINPEFRADFAGRQPGTALRMAMDCGLLPAVEAVFTTDQRDAGVHVPAVSLNGATPISGAVGRDQLSTVTELGLGAVVDAAETLLAFREPPSLAQTSVDLVAARGTDIAVRVLAAHMIADAKNGSRYAGRQLARLLGLPIPE